MIYKLFFIVMAICLMFSCMASKTQETLPLFKITGLDSTQRNYIIYAYTDDTIRHMILSKKEYPDEGRIIRIGRKYRLKLNSLIDPLFSDLHVRLPAYRSGLMFNGENFKLDSVFYYELYSSGNIRGLKYQP